MEPTDTTTHPALVDPRPAFATASATLVEIADGELCCGSAGTYNIQQPELAGQLGEQKARNVLATGADVLVTGNIGCLTQIDLHLRRLGKPVPMMHTIELLDRAMAQPVGPIVG